MTVRDKKVAALAPWLFIASGLMWFLAAWLGEQIAFTRIGIMFLTLGLAAWTKARKAGGS